MSAILLSSHLFHICIPFISTTPWPTIIYSYLHLFENNISVLFEQLYGLMPQYMCTIQKVISNTANGSV